MGALSFCPLLLVLLVVAVVSASSPYSRKNAAVFREKSAVEKNYEDGLRTLSELLSQPQVPERKLTGRESFHANLKSSKSVLRFSWSNCGSASDPVQIKNLNVQPDPIHVPGDIQLSFDISSSVDVTEPFELDVDIQKKVLFWWVEVPCLNELGSCNYKDMCTKLPATCPPSFVKSNVPCNCPISKGEYTMQGGAVTIPKLVIPSWLTSGDYKAQLQGNAADGSRLFCLALDLTMD